MSWIVGYKEPRRINIHHSFTVPASIMKAHNLKMIKKKLKSSKGKVFKKCAFNWEIKVSNKGLCKRNKTVLDARQKTVMEYTPSMKQNTTNRSQGLKLYFQPLVYSATPLKWGVEEPLRTGRLFHPTLSRMNEECHRPSIQANEFGEVVKAWKIPNELQEVSQSVIELTTLNDSQQKAVCEVLNLMSTMFNKSLIISPPSDSDTQDESYSNSSSLDSSFESKSYSSESSYGLGPVDHEDQHSDLMFDDCDEIKNSSSSSSDGSGLEDKQYMSDSPMSDELESSNNDSGDDDDYSSSSKTSMEQDNQIENSSCPGIFSHLPNFPLLTIEQFFEMDTKLETSLDYRMRLTFYLSALCEKNQRESVKIILRHSLDDKVVGKYNRTGRGRTKKAALNETTFYEVVKDAIQMRFIPNYDDALVKIAVTKYLGNVKNVKGGRAKL